MLTTRSVWLSVSQFSEYVPALLENATLARAWLMQMGAAAQRAGLTVQYCMPSARHLLASLEIPAVTQARASDDYKPSDDTEQWRIGGQSALMDALGLAPSKDGFWSTSVQSGNPYGDDHTEPHPELEAAVLALSAGPVAVADAVGLTDAALVKRACRADGRLLQPSEPAKLVDAAYIARAGHGGARVDGAIAALADGGGNAGGELWAARSAVAGRVFGYVFGANLSASVDVTPAMLRDTLGDDGDAATAWLVVDARAMIAAAEGTGPPASSLAAREFSAAAPLAVAACGRDDFQLFTLTPVEPNGWALAGELGKWVGVSSSRWLEVTTTPTSMLVEARGAPGERVVVGFVAPNRTLVANECEVGAEGAVKIAPDACF